MAASGPISIQDETGVTQLAGTATFPDGIAADGVSTPDAAGNTDPILVKTGDSSAGDSGDVTIESGTVAADGKTSGAVVIQSGDAGATGEAGTGNVEIKTGDVADGAGGGDAGDILIQGGDGDLGGGDGGDVTIQGGAGDSTGTVELSGPGSVVLTPDGDVTISPTGAVIVTPGSGVVINPTGNIDMSPGGDVSIAPTGDLNIGDGYLQLTVAAAVPTTYTTPLHYDSTGVTGGLYAWDGSAYQKVGNVVS